MFGSRMEGVREGLVLEVEPRVVAVYSGFGPVALLKFLRRVMVWEKEGYDAPLEVMGTGLWAYHEDVYTVRVLFPNRGVLERFEEDFATWGISQDLS
jgi:hypothetical protein